MSSFSGISDFYIIKPASMDFLLDWIYIKRPRSSYTTLFLKNIVVPACFPLDNILKIIIPKNETVEVYNSRIMKRRSSFSMSRIIDFYIINPASMDFLLDWIYIKRPRSSYITLFLRDNFILACFPLDNILIISNLLFF